MRLHEIVAELGSCEIAVGGFLVCLVYLPLTSHRCRRGSVRLGFVSAGGFFGEVPMLDDAAAAELRERTVTAVTDCRLVYLEKDALEKLKQRYPELQLRVRQCARVGRHVNKKGRKFKDAVKLSSMLKPTWGRTQSTPNLTAHMSPGCAHHPFGAFDCLWNAARTVLLRLCSNPYLQKAEAPVP